MPTCVNGITSKRIFQVHIFLSGFKTMHTYLSTKNYNAHHREIFSLTHANTYAATTQGELDTTLGSKQRSWAEPAPGQRQGTTQQLNHNTLDLEPMIAPHVVTSTSQHCHRRTLPAGTVSSPDSSTSESMRPLRGARLSSLGTTEHQGTRRANTHVFILRFATPRHRRDVGIRHRNLRSPTHQENAFWEAARATAPSSACTAHAPHSHCTALLPPRSNILSTPR